MQDRIDRLERDARETRHLMRVGYVLGGLILVFMTAQGALLYFTIVSMDSRPLALIAVALLCWLGGVICLFVVARGLDQEAATLARIQEAIHWERIL